MFETLVVTKTEKPGARSMLSLPAALTFHAVAGLGFLLFSLYAPDTLQAPPYAAVLWETPPVPVTFVQRHELQNRNAPTTKPAPPSDGGLEDPGQAPPTVQDPPPPGAGPGAPGPDVPGALPSDLLLPGEADPHPGFTGPAPVVPPWQLLEPPRLLLQVRPEYPPALRMMGVGGKVVLEVMVDEAGSVASVRVVASPHPMLSRAAEDAVWQWKYTRPVPAGGGSARVVQTVVVDFTLR